MSAAENSVQVLLWSLEEFPLAKTYGWKIPVESSKKIAPPYVETGRVDQLNLRDIAFRVRRNERRRAAVGHVLPPTAVRTRMFLRTLLDDRNRAAKFLAGWENPAQRKATLLEFGISLSYGYTVHRIVKAFLSEVST